jgi:hypothetical protein
LAKNIVIKKCGLTEEGGKPLKKFLENEVFRLLCEQGVLNLNFIILHPGEKDM